MNYEDLKKCFHHTLNATFCSTGIYIGSRLRIFEKLIELDSPKTCYELSVICQYKERYMREWLGLMVTTRVISVDGSENEDKYYLSDEQKRAIKESEEVILMTELAHRFMENQSELLTCFDPNGPRGVSYEAYDRSGGFDLLGKFRNLSKSEKEKEKIVDLVPGLREKLTSENFRVLEIGCNRGFNLIHLAKVFPNTQFVGQDISEGGIAEAKKLSAGLKNVKFSIQNACEKTEFKDGTFDWIFGMDVVHDLPYPSNALKEINRILKDDGIISIIDVNCHTRHSLNTNSPIAAFIYGNSLLHCLPVSYSLPNSAGLGAAWGMEKAHEMFKEANFQVENQHELGTGFEMAYILKKN